MDEHREEQQCWLDELGKKLEERDAKEKEDKRVCKELREREMPMKREKAARAKAAGKHGDKTRKRPRWTHDH
jgi:hypothetical protein